jgi:hypothetical protein
MKSLLLFFDHFALVLPQRLYRQVVSEDRILAKPLEEKGILLNFEPRSWLNESDSNRIVGSVFDAMADDLIFDGKAEKWLSRSTTHFGFDSSATLSLLAALRERGLASEKEEDTVIHMSPQVRLIILTQLANVFFQKSSDMGIDLSLISFDRTEARDLADERFATRKSQHPASKMVTRDTLEFKAIWTDFQEVGVDLSAVPLDEILEFRLRHGPEYRAYIRNLRSFARNFELSAEMWDYDEQFWERREELQDQAADLRRLSRQTFGRRAAILTVTAGALGSSFYYGDPVGAALSALAAAFSLPSFPDRTERPFAYLFAIKDEFKARWRQI